VVDDDKSRYNKPYSLISKEYFLNGPPRSTRTLNSLFYFLALMKITIFLEA